MTGKGITTTKGFRKPLRKRACNFLIFGFPRRACEGLVGPSVKLTEECKQLVTEPRKGKQPEDFLFAWENGEPIRDFGGSWDGLTKAAGVPGLLFHDLRHSAVRNMVRRGVPQKTARTVSGHKTDAVFSRYNIVSEADLRDAARKIEEGAKAAVSGSIHSS